MPVNKWYEFLTFNTTEDRTRQFTFFFSSQLPPEERRIINFIVEGHYDLAIIAIAELINEEDFGAGPGYTNQDPTYIRG